MVLVCVDMKVRFPYQNAKSLRLSVQMSVFMVIGLGWLTDFMVLNKRDWRLEWGHYLSCTLARQFVCVDRTYMTPSTCLCLIIRVYACVLKQMCMQIDWCERWKDNDEFF